MFKVMKTWLEKPEVLDKEVVQNWPIRCLFYVTALFQRNFFLMLGIAVGLLLLVALLAMNGGGQ